MNQEHATKRVAIVHDFLLYSGGAEHVLGEIAQMYPDAPIYTLLYDEHKMGASWGSRDIRTSFLQKWPGWLKKRHRFLLPFYATAVESLDLREYDLVISSSGAWSKGLVTRLYTTHVAYIHSPMRYIWDENERYLSRVVKRRRFPLRQYLSYLRIWDYQAAQRPDVLIANSLYTKDRIAKYYRRDAQVVHPPVSRPAFTGEKSAGGVSQGQKPFVIISRLSPYKNVELAIDVCNKLTLPLIVIGEGGQSEYLAQKAGKTIQMKGWCSEQEKWNILRDARALLFPSVDDFGLTCVESLLCGVPVIGLGQGALPEIIEDGVHGVHFHEPTPEVIADGIRRFIKMEETFDRDVLINRGEVFSREQFERALREHITQAL